MWALEKSSDWMRSFKWYQKKREDELAAVLNNLSKLERLLATAKNSKTVQAGFLHTEPMGVLAIDQRGPSKTQLQETRMYVFVDDESRTIHLITIGDKDSQSDDIKYCKEYMENLRRSQEPPNDAAKA